MKKKEKKKAILDYMFCEWVKGVYTHLSFSISLLQRYIPAGRVHSYFTWSHLAGVVRGSSDLYISTYRGQ